MLILGVTFIGIVTKLLIAVNVLVCIMLIFVVLLQRPKNEGLGAAFGGDTASNIFGAQTTNVLANLTRWLAGLFMVITLALSILYSKNEDSLTAVSKYLSAQKVKQEEDAARKTAEDAAKAEAAKAEAAKPVVPATSDALKVPVEAVPAVPPVAPEKAPETPKTPEPAATPTPPAPAPGENIPPKPTEPAPAKPAEPAAPEPAKPAEPAAPEAPKPPEPAAPEPAKPAGN